MARVEMKERKTAAGCNSKKIALKFIIKIKIYKFRELIYDMFKLFVLIGDISLKFRCFSMFKRVSLKTPLWLRGEIKAPLF